MINHITLCVTDREKSKRFYAAALAPLGYELFDHQDSDGDIGLGTKDDQGWRDVWLKEVEELGSPRSFSCLAFTASSKQQVDEFYHAALANGGTDNGKPGYRTKYYAGYYAAFVLDPDGYNIEVVYDDPSPPNE
ncbi:VOC family protein [Candidatus Berkelbacteria bacterium]|nr:VOC family protein [Candidatus Berkelbacteria bacterium]